MFLSIGSNKGKRFENIKKSILLIKSQSDIKFIKKSNIYETEPMYNISQDYFLNMVILIKTKLNPENLLQFTQSVEKKIGRINIEKRKNQPREIDIDILTYDNKNISTDNLIIPHPKAHERVFVLKPWSEIVPDFKLYNMQETISELLLNLSINSKTIKYYTEI